MLYHACKNWLIVVIIEEIVILTTIMMGNMYYEQPRREFGSFDRNPIYKSDSGVLSLLLLVFSCLFYI